MIAGARPARGARRLLGTLAVVLGVTLLVGCGGKDPLPSTPGAEYVALGDSSSSGAGIAPLKNAACQRSEKNYASQVAAELHYTSFEDMTCGGATTADLTKAQTPNTDDPQLDPVGQRTRLVTLSLGLNDDRISAALLYACLADTSGNQQEPPDTSTPTTWCRTILGVTEAQTETALAHSAEAVEKAITLIRKRAPHAQVILVGYPRLLPDSGTCPDRAPYYDGMVPRLRNAFAVASNLWRGAAEHAGAEYVDSYAMSEGHDICAADPWVNGAHDGGGKAAPLHPFVAFHDAVAKAIVDLVQK